MAAFAGMSRVGGGGCAHHLAWIVERRLRQAGALCRRPRRGCVRRRGREHGALLPQLPRLLFQYAPAHCGQLCQCRMARAIPNRSLERPGLVVLRLSQPPQVRGDHRLCISSNRDANFSAPPRPALSAAPTNCGDAPACGRRSRRASCARLRGRPPARRDAARGALVPAPGMRPRNVAGSRGMRACGRCGRAGRGAPHGRPSIPYVKYPCKASIIHK